MTVAVDGPPVAAGPWMEWHDDVFTAPAGFDVLARNDVGPQLIRRSPHVGTQFHPEATETMVRDWIEHGGAEQYRRTAATPTRCSPRPVPTRRPAARPPSPSSTGSSTHVAASRRERRCHGSPENGRGRVWEGIHEPW